MRRINVVEDEKTRVFAFDVDEVIGKWIECVLQGDIAEGRAAYAEDDEVFAFGLEVFD